MELKRAVMFGVLLWAIIFFEVSILMFGFNLETPMRTYVHYFLLVFIVSFVSYFYFKKEKANTKNGFIFGVVCVVTGILLDVVITVPLFVKSYYFFVDVYLWIGFLEGVVLTTIFGTLAKK